MRIVILKKGGEPGEVAVNPDQVTHVRSTGGPFTDIYFGETRVAVEGSLRQVVDRLTGKDELIPEAPPARSWLSQAK